MKILVTGSNGFIAKNLIQKLDERESFEVIGFSRDNSKDDLQKMIIESDFIYHLAGANRPKDSDEFISDNLDLTAEIIKILQSNGRSTPILFSSSTQVLGNNLYAKSKASAESILLDYQKNTSANVFIYRLPNVFGKWSKPNYNSVVSTFCYNIANDLPISIHDQDKDISLVYIDDVCSNFLDHLDNSSNSGFLEIKPVYNLTLGKLASIIISFKNSRNNLLIDDVGNGLGRALYSTYLSYLNPSQFTYQIKHNIDNRGIFAEVLKTPHAGQFSFFTAHKSVTRGGHYHHTKNEKFLVVQGSARFRFKNILTHETYEIEVNDKDFSVVETIPGWAHDITNIGEKNLIVMLWANEIFDPENPDTYNMELK